MLLLARGSGASLAHDWQVGWGRDAFYTHGAGDTRGLTHNGHTPLLRNRWAFPESGGPNPRELSRQSTSRGEICTCSTHAKGQIDGPAAVSCHNVTLQACAHTRPVVQPLQPWHLEIHYHSRPCCVLHNHRCISDFVALHTTMELHPAHSKTRLGTRGAAHNQVQTGSQTYTCSA